MDTDYNMYAAMNAIVDAIHAPSQIVPSTYFQSVRMRQGTDAGAALTTGTDHAINRDTHANHQGPHVRERGKEMPVEEPAAPPKAAHYLPVLIIGGILVYAYLYR